MMRSLTLAEAGVRVFYEAALTVLLHRPVSLQGHVTVLDVQLLQLVAVLRYRHDPQVRDGVTRLDAQLPQLAAVRQRHKSFVRDVTFTDV